jgi:tetratricopeptide (TPR) repeat protein
MVFLRKTLTIVLALISLPMAAKQPAELSVEQKQQFTYYWYAARQALDHERYSDALVLLEFCKMLNPDDGTTLGTLGVLYDGLHQKDRAMEMFRLAYETDPRDQWYRYSQALLGQRNETSFREAVAVMEHALQLNRENEEVLNGLCRLYMADRQWKKTLQMQERLDRIKGYDGYSALTRYRIYALWGKPRKAFEEANTYLEQDPANIQFLVLRVEALEQLKPKKETLYAAYESVLAIDPSNLAILNNYAYHMAIHGGDLKKAERMSELTIREQPNNPVYLDTYGWILHLQGQNQLALFYLQRAAQYATDESRIEIEKHLKAVK